MNIVNYLIGFINKESPIQELILNYLEDENDDESILINLIKKIKLKKFCEDKIELKSLLHLISKISDNHHRGNGFISKIEKIRISFQSEITKEFTNYDIFNIFKSNKRILLFLFKEKIINPDESILKTITNSKYVKNGYPQYFFNEFKSMYSNHFCQMMKFDKIPNSFELKRQIGENESQICQLIRNDSIDEFASYFELNDLTPSKLIEKSIFETNEFLLNNNLNIIEYCAFCGATKIFKYLLEYRTELRPMVWISAIHSHNFEMIHLIE